MLRVLALLALIVALTQAFVPRSRFLRVSGIMKPSVEMESVRAKVQVGKQVRGVRGMEPLRDILGLGPAEIAITLVVGLVLFGPETLKSLSKDVGKAAAELKEIPKTFKEGMEEGAESSQVSKMKAIAAEKKKKRDAKKAKDENEDEEEEDDDDEDDDDDDE